MTAQPTSIRLECKGPNDTNWSVLNRDVLPLGESPKEQGERARIEKEMDNRRTYWPRAYHEFADHEFRIVRE